MNRNNKTTKQGSNLTVNLLGILISNIFSIISLILLTLAVSLFLLNAEKIPESFIMHFYFCTVFPSFICGFIASKMCTVKGIIAGTAAAIPYNFIITIILLFVSDGKIRGDIGIFFVMTTIFSVIGGIAGANTKRRK